MNNIKENLENKVEQDKATILALLQRRPVGTYTDDVAEMTGLRFERVIHLLWLLESEKKAERREVDYDKLPVAIRSKVKPGMSRNLWRSV